MADGSGDAWQEPYPGYPGNQDTLWNVRPDPYGYGPLGQDAEETGTLFEANENSYGQLKTVSSGLVDGQEYDVYVVFASKGAGENWNATASLSPISLGANNLVTSGLTYGNTVATYTALDTVSTVDILAGTATGGDFGGGILAFMGKVGTITGDAGGVLDVYIDDLEDGVNVNNRTWYDGVYLQAIPEPATIGLVGIFGAGLLFVRRKIKL